MGNVKLAQLRFVAFLFRMTNKLLRRRFCLICVLACGICVYLRKSEFLFGLITHARPFTMTKQHVKILQEWQHLTVSNWSSIENTSSAEHSLVVLHNPQKYYCMGEVLNVTVTMMDYNSRPKSYGGDFLLARIYSPTVEASASGVVTDFHNGSYLISFTLFWAGEVRMSVVLVHPSEAVQALWRTRQKSYSKIRHTGYFVNDGKTENTECGFQLSANRSQCFYGDRFSGEFFSCYTPPTLPCHTLDSMSSVNGDGESFNKKEAFLLTRTNTGKVINSNIAILVKDCAGFPKIPPKQCNSRALFTIPSGYFLKNKWTSPCADLESLLNLESIHKCLTGRKLYFWGDSTVRQWLELIMEIRKDPKQNNPTNLYHARMQLSDAERNYTMHWQTHGQPWVSLTRISVTDTDFVSRRLDSITGMSGEAVVVIALGQHFRPYPLDLFLKRMLSLRRAIKKLQKRSPQTRVFIKLENTRELNSDPLRFSNWHGHVQNSIQREVFRNLGVGLVDPWDITVARDTFALHPDEGIVRSQVAIFLSQLCNSQYSNSVGQ